MAFVEDLIKIAEYLRSQKAENLHINKFITKDDRLDLTIRYDEFMFFPKHYNYEVRLLIYDKSKARDSEHYTISICALRMVKESTVSLIEMRNYNYFHHVHAKSLFITLESAEERFNKLVKSHHVSGLDSAIRDLMISVI